MGKHSKKKTENTRPLSPREEPKTRDPYEDWFCAAGRELDFDEVFEDAEALPLSAFEDAGDPPLKSSEPVWSDGAKPEAALALETEEESPEDLLSADPETEIEAELLLSPLPEEDSAAVVKPAPAKRADPPRPGDRRPARPKGSGEPVRSSSRSNSGKGGVPVRSGKRGKKKRRSRAFRKGLRTYIIIMLVLILAICAALWVLLSRYQAKADAEAAKEAARLAEIQQKRELEEAIRQAPQKTFLAWLEQTGPDDWTELWYAGAASDLDPRENVRSWMEEHFAAAEPFRAADYTAEAPVYVLREGDAPLARIYLTGSGADWTVSRVELLVKGKESASVTAITGSRVFCNGRELGSEYITDTTSPFTYEPLADKLVNPVERITYGVKGLLLPPELTAEPPAGVTLTETSGGDFLPGLQGEAADAMSKRAVDFVKAYLFYYLKGSNNTYGNLAYALTFLTPGTQAYKDLNDTSIGVVWNPVYNNIDSSNTVASPVVVWADNCCSVDVSYDTTYTLNDGSTDHSVGTMRIYYLKADNGNYYISHFETL